VVGWLRFKDVTMIILLRKEEREHERECTIRLDQPAFYTILKKERGRVCHHEEVRVVSCCIELPHWKAGKGEGKCPGV
jgi:hypothetical protein